MSKSRRVGTWIGLTVAALLALVVVLKSCGTPESAPLPPTGVADAKQSSSESSTARRSPPRAARRRPSADTVPEQPTASPSAKDAPAGSVRVTVTCGGQPLPNATVMLHDTALSGRLQTAASDKETWSDGAYFGTPRHLGLAVDYHPVIGVGYVPSGRVRASETGLDGTAVVTAASGKTYEVIVLSKAEPMIQRERPVVTLPEGSETEASVEVARAAKVTGRCVDQDGGPVGAALVQALAADAERAISALATADGDGAFTLEIAESETSFRVRAVAPRQFNLCDTEAKLPSVPADTTVAVHGIPRGDPIEVRMPRADGVVLDITGEVPFGHLQIEVLAFDASANAWGRLGGPSYQRSAQAAADPKHAFAFVPRSDADRPLMLWTWGPPPMLTNIDPRGRFRVPVEFRKGRTVSVSGSGWRDFDRVRVICRVGAIDGIWVESEVHANSTWGRDDTPPCEIECRLVRDGREIGPRPVVPAGTEAASVRIDL